MGVMGYFLLDCTKHDNIFCAVVFYQKKSFRSEESVLHIFFYFSGDQPFRAQLWSFSFFKWNYIVGKVVLIW